MTGAANTAVPAKTEIGLVLQGGGALGAYEWGAITALFDVIDEAIGSGQDITLRVVTGVSIGAINAACVVGATDRADARNRARRDVGRFHDRPALLAALGKSRPRPL
jgi:predicted acylesterase/phospholipase RssA